MLVSRFNTKLGEWSHVSYKALQVGDKICYENQVYYVEGTPTILPDSTVALRVSNMMDRTKLYTLLIKHGPDDTPLDATPAKKKEIQREQFQAAIAQDVETAKKKGIPKWQIEKEQFQAALAQDVETIGAEIAQELRASGVQLVFMDAGHLISYTSTSTFHSKTKYHAPPLMVAVGYSVKDLLNQVRDDLNKQYEVYRGVLIPEDLLYHVAINHVGKYLTKDTKVTLTLHYQVTAIHAAEAVKIVE